MLTGKHIVLTGANGGIGLEVARLFLQNHSQCLLADRQTISDETQALMAQYPEQCFYHECDITLGDQREALLREAMARFGGVDVLYNNAAIFDMAPLLESDEQMYERIFDVNVKALFFLLQAVARIMVEQGTRGSIINLASQAGRRGEALVSHYCASKAAVISYTQSAALALAEHGIRVNALAPGVVDTPMWDTVDALFSRYEKLPLGEKKRQVGEAVPLGRMGRPDDIAGAALFLASDLSNYITGQTLNVDGGNVLS